MLVSGLDGRFCLMSAHTLNQRDIDFFYMNSSTPRDFFSDRVILTTLESFDAIISGVRDIATKFYANHYQEADEHEPLFENGAVQLIPPIKAAWDATVEFGLLGASYDYDEGGVQLPDVISKVAGGLIQAANSGSSGYYFVTNAASNLIRTFGSEQQKSSFWNPWSMAEAQALWL